MPQHVSQCTLVGPPALEAALIGSRVGAYRQLHAISDQAAQDRFHRALSFKLLKDCSNHCLNLLVGVQAHFARRSAEVADGGATG